MITKCVFFLIVVTVSAETRWASSEKNTDVVQHPRNTVRNQRTINVDSRFQKWQDKNNILYYLDPAYTDKEKQLIRGAAQLVEAGTGNCVKFVEVASTDTRYKVKVTPFDSFAASGGQPVCFSYAGRSILTTGTEQNMVLTRGEFGCLADTDTASIMSYWANLLGRRNEHERGDRDKYITMNWQNIVFPTAYRLYTSTDAYWGAYPYDYCSITHNTPSKLAKAGTLGFSVNTDPKAIPNLPQLSNTDCQLLTQMYKCDSSKCQAFDCTTARQNALLPKLPTTGGGATSTPTSTPRPTTPAVTTPAVTTPAVTTPAVTTPAVTTPAVTTPAVTTPAVTTPAVTTAAAVSCNMAAMCAKSPDESQFLLGPFQFQTYLMFSGPCVMEYKMDYAAAQLESQTPPQPITEYFPPPGGPSIVPPITFGYLDANADLSAFTVNMQNQAGAQMLQCPTNAGVFTRAATCPATAIKTGIIPVSTATSATSQFSTSGDNLVYHFAVDATGTNINLYDARFTTILQRTNGFLTGQSRIVKITAIQLIQDIAEGVQPQMLMVAGVGSDNVTPYVGYAVFPLDALPGAALSPIAWTAEPLPLRNALKGC